MNRKDNELQRVAEQNLTNEKRLADWQEKRASMDVTDPREDYMDWSQMDSDEDYIRKNST